MVCKGKEHQVYDELIGESKDTKDADRFAEVEKIEAMSPEERFAFFQNDYQNVSAVMPAVTYVRHAAAVNVYLTAQNSTVHRRQMWMISKRRCSTLSVHST